jgi:hypothetical protein
MIEYFLSRARIFHFGHEDIEFSTHFMIKTALVLWQPRAYSQLGWMCAGTAPSHCCCSPRPLHPGFPFQEEKIHRLAFPTFIKKKKT